MRVLSQTGSDIVEAKRDQEERRPLTPQEIERLKEDARKRIQEHDQEKQGNTPPAPPAPVPTPP